MEILLLWVSFPGFFSPLATSTEGGREAGGSVCVDYSSWSLRGPSCCSWGERTLPKRRFPSGLMPAALSRGAAAPHTCPSCKLVTGQRFPTHECCLESEWKNKKTELRSGLLRHGFLISSFLWVYEHPAGRKLASRSQHLWCGNGPTCGAQGQVGTGAWGKGVGLRWPWKPYSPFSSWVCSPRCESTTAFVLWLILDSKILFQKITIFLLISGWKILISFLKSLSFVF